MDRSFLRIYHLLCVLVLVFLIANEGFSQAININGGNITLTITTGMPDVQQLTSVTNSTCTMQYRRQARISKITVAATCPGQSFNLSVVATNITISGTAQPTVSLISGNPAMDFIRDNSTAGARRSCTLNYTASATFAQGCSTNVGNDVYTVTYTLVVQ